jgi:hypothetical protein
MAANKFTGGLRRIARLGTSVLSGKSFQFDENDRETVNGAMRYQDYAPSRGSIILRAMTAPAGGQLFDIVPPS